VAGIRVRHRVIVDINGCTDLETGSRTHDGVLQREIVRDDLDDFVDFGGDAERLQGQPDDRDVWGRDEEVSTPIRFDGRLDGCRDVRGVSDQSTRCADALDGDGLVDQQAQGVATRIGVVGRVVVGALVIGARSDEDGVAVGSRVDGCLEAAVAAVADEQELARTAAVDDLDRGKRVGTFGASRDIPAAATVAGDTGSGQSASVERGVDARATVDRVVARTAGYGVVAVNTREAVGARVAGDGLGKFVSGEGDARAVGAQVLDLGAGCQGVADCCPSRIGAFAGEFGDHVTGVVDHIEVVAIATAHGVGAATTMKYIVAACAGKGVDAGQALQHGERAATVGARETRGVDGAAHLVGIEDTPGGTDVRHDTGHREIGEILDPIDTDGILGISATDAQIGQCQVPGGAVGAANVLQALQLDRFVRSGAGEARIIDGQVAVVAIHDHVATAVGSGDRTVVAEYAVEDLDVAHRVREDRRRGTIPRTDVGKAVLVGILHLDMVEHDGARKGGRVVADVESPRLACRVYAQVAEAQSAIQFAGGDGLALDGRRANALALDGDRETAGDRQVFDEGARPNHDRIATCCRIDGCLDAAIAAVADEQELARTSAVDEFDPGKRVGAFGARRDIPAAAAIGGDTGRGQRAGVERGVDAGATVDGVVAAGAADRVVASLAIQAILPIVAGHDVDVAVPRAVDAVAAKQNEVVGASGQGQGAVVIHRDLAGDRVARQRIVGRDRLVDVEEHQIAGHRVAGDRGVIRRLNLQRAGQCAVGDGYIVDVCGMFAEHIDNDLAIACSASVFCAADVIDIEVGQHRARLLADRDVGAIVACCALNHVESSEVDTVDRDVLVAGVALQVDDKPAQQSASDVNAGLNKVEIGQCGIIELFCVDAELGLVVEGKLVQQNIADRTAGRIAVLGEVDAELTPIEDGVGNRQTIHISRGTGPQADLAP